MPMCCKLREVTSDVAGVKPVHIECIEHLSCNGQNKYELCKISVQ